MSLLGFLTRRSSAPVARERLQILLAHERVATGNDLVAVLREEILAVIAKHVELDSERVHVKMDRDERFSILEIDVEIPLEAKLEAA